MTKTKNGKLFSVKMILKHVFKSDVCSGEMLVSCQIGTKRIEVGREQFHTCPVTGMYYNVYDFRSFFFHYIHIFALFILSISKKINV